MEFSIKLHTIKTGCSIIYIEGSKVIISLKNIVFLSLRIFFVFADSGDPDEMPHNVAFHLGLNCFSKYLFMGFPVFKGLKIKVLIKNGMGYGKCS